MSRKPRLRDALDASLARILRGQSISQCIYHYPNHERQLRPLLEAALALRRLPVPQPRPEAVEEGYARMMGALDAKRRQQQAEAQATEERSGLFGALRSPSSARWLAMGGVAALILLLIGFVWVWQAGDFSSVLFEPTRAVVTEVEGMVLRLPSDSRTWQSIVVGDSVDTDDRLQTMAEARAVVEIGSRDSVEMLGAAEAAFLELPSRWAPRTSPGVQHMRGVIRYNVAPEGGLTQAPDPVEMTWFRAQPVLAAPVADSALGDQDGTAHFDVHAPVLMVRAEHARFVVTVDEDGATSVVVEEGTVTIIADDQSETVSAGQQASRAAGENRPLRIAPIDLLDFESQLPGPFGEEAGGTRPTPGGDTPTPGEDRLDTPTIVPGTPTVGPTPGPEGAGTTPTTVPPGTPDPADGTSPPDSGESPPDGGNSPPSTGDDPPPTDTNPPDTDTEPPADEGGGSVPPVPPGQEDKDRDNTPPGLEDRQGEPPGQDKKPTPNDDVSDNTVEDESSSPSAPVSAPEPPGRSGDHPGKGK